MRNMRVESLLPRINSCFQGCGLRQGSKIHSTTCVCINRALLEHSHSHFFFNILSMTPFMLQVFVAETRRPAKDIYYITVYRKRPVGSICALSFSLVLFFSFFLQKTIVVTPILGLLRLKLVRRGQDERFPLTAVKGFPCSVNEG